MRSVLVEASVWGRLRTHAEQMYEPVHDEPDAPLGPATNRGHVAIEGFYHPVIRALVPPGCGQRALRIPAAVAFQWSVDMMAGATALGATLACLALGQPRLSAAYAENHAFHLFVFFGTMVTAACLGANVGFWMWVIPKITG